MDRAEGEPGACLLTIVLVAAMAGGCNLGVRHEVVAVTETNIGVDLSQNPANQTPQGRLGYQRVEVAIVPTGRSGNVDPGNNQQGAATLADVIMELRYMGIFGSGENSGIYQRLAVGKDAVSQPGAWAMLARDGTGKVDKETAAALNQLKSLEVSGVVRQGKYDIVRAYIDPSKRAAIDKEVSSLGYRTFSDFMDGKPSVEQIDQVKKAAGL